MGAPSVRVDLSILPDVTVPLFYPLYEDWSRYLVLYGGAGSGKSVFAAEKLIYRTLCERGHKFLVVRKVAKTIRESCFAELKGIISQWGLQKLFTITDMSITCVNGNSIIFAGLDDPEKIKSISGITGIWIEEASELDQQDFIQLDLRLRGRKAHYKQVIITFNPVSIVHWLKTVFVDKPLVGTQAVHSTYKDNPYLDDEYKRVLEAMRDVDDYYYMVYALGQWGVIGKTVYNARIVTERLVQLMERKPLRAGIFIYRHQEGNPEQIDDSTIELIEDGTGPVRIYAEPQKGHPYILGGDIAEGGIDYSAASVRSNTTWNQAAVYHGRSDTDDYTKQMYCLGTYYNRALIGIETNFDMHPVKELQRLGYSDQYVTEQLDKYTGETTKRFGFKTTKVTRPIIIAKHVALAREHIDTWNDRASVEEMLTFVRDESGRPAAQTGKHDDLIFADAICLEIRQQGRFTVQVERQELPPIAKHKEARARQAHNGRLKRALLS